MTPQAMQLSITGSGKSLGVNIYASFNNNNNNDNNNNVISVKFHEVQRYRGVGGGRGGPIQLKQIGF